MYGRKPYGRIDKPVDKSEVDSSGPTFLCSKCHRIKLQSTGYTDILLTPQVQSNKLYRICTDCSVLLKTWVDA